MQSRRNEEDTASLELTMGDGVTVQSFFSTSAGDVDKVEIYGEKGPLRRLFCRRHHLNGATNGGGEKFYE